MRSAYLIKFFRTLIKPRDPTQGFGSPNICENYHFLLKNLIDFSHIIFFSEWPLTAQKTFFCKKYQLCTQIKF